MTIFLLIFKGSDNGDDEEGSDSDEESDHSGNEEMDIEAPEANETVDDQTMEKLNDPSDNPLLVTMEEKDAPTLKERKASMWFGKDVFQGKQVLTNEDKFLPIWTSLDQLGPGLIRTSFDQFGQVLTN